MYGFVSTVTTLIEVLRIQKTIGQTVLHVPSLTHTSSPKFSLLLFNIIGIIVQEGVCICIGVIFSKGLLV